MSKKEKKYTYATSYTYNQPDDKNGKTEHLLPFARVFKLTVDDNSYELYNQPN